jgi:hypothetical protein
MQALAAGLSIPATALGVSCLLGSLLQLGMIVTYQPYIHHFWNKLHGGLSAVCVWAAVCMLLALWRAGVEPTGSMVSLTQNLNPVPLPPASS